ncbi:YncE family protein [Kaistella sp.]|uniref:YncE family protein n=1 Tax=Kaistella sp. TaxID=2782235 RepID=UPI003C52CBB5
MKTKLLLLALAALFIQTKAQSKNESFKVLKSIPVSGNGGWDYLTVNPNNHFVYASHSTQVNIINPKTSASEGVIENQNGVHGIAFDQENRGYITNGKSNTVFVFDVKTNAKVASIEVGKKPDAVIFDEYSKKIIVANAGSNSLSIINPKNLTVEKTIELSGNPEYLVSDLKGKIYVNIEDQSKIAEINLAEGKVLNYFSLGKDTGPSGLAIDNKTHRLFSACEEHLVILNAENGKIVNSLPLAKGCDGVVFDPKSNMIFASTYSGVLSSYLEKSKDEIVALNDIKTEVGARTIALDENTQKIYVSTSEFGSAVDKNARRLPLKENLFHILEIGQ